MKTGFSSTSTAEEVLAGVDLSGRRILVTGVSAGIGIETTRALVAHGATVVGAARNLAKAQSTVEQIRGQALSGAGLELIELDLASLASVRSCADLLLGAGKPFDGIIANAGLMAGPKAETADGIEAQFGTNYLGHFVLVNRIARMLRPGARVVMVYSAGHRRADVDRKILILGRPPTTNIWRTGARKRRPSSLQSSSTGVIELRAYGPRRSIRVRSKLQQFKS